MLVAIPEAPGAQTYVYVNDDAQPNTITGFSVGVGGQLVPLAGSPFATGQDGCLGNAFPSTTNVTVAGSFLYAANCFSQNVSGFAINPATGALTPVPGSPFAIAPSNLFDRPEIPLAATPNGQYLIAVTDTADATGLGNARIHVFSIAAGTGTLTEVATSPLLTTCPRIGGIKVSPNGGLLAATCPAHVTIYMFGITAAGGLTAVAGSPFAADVFPPGVPLSADISCGNDRLFVGVATGGPAAVGVFTISPAGILAPIAGSPFSPGGGTGSSVAVLSPDDQLLYVGNQGSSTVTVLGVAPAGTLSLVAGSPFAASDCPFPSGMVTDPTGAFLYLVGNTRNVCGYSVAPGGELTPVASSPFSTNEFGAPASLAAYPPKSCASPGTVTASVDIKLCSNPNGFNCGSRGVLPVTIFGTADLNVHGISISTLRLCLASDPTQCTGAPVSWSFLDRGNPSVDIGAATCTVVTGIEQRYRTPDGLTDLDVTFNAQQVAALIGCAGLSKGESSPTLILTGQTTTGQSIASVPVGDIGVDQLLVQK
jgi:6-phosphogluconolactonase (cycloisomerase 2 family)